MLFEEKLNRKVATYGSYWRDAPLNYAELKHLVSDAAANGSDAEERRKAFFAALEAEIGRLNKVFGRLAKAAMREHQPRKAIMTEDNKAVAPGGRYGLTQLKGLFSSNPNSSNGTVPEVSLARLCNEYARVNTSGVREILKECDKEWGGKEGMEYWKMIWRNQSNAVAFVHSPTRVQIDAIESVDAWIAHRSSKREQKIEEKARIPKSHLSTADLTCPICLAKAAKMEERALIPRIRLATADLMCPICLDVLYTPVALSCGHVFCFQCLLKACEMGKTIGTMQTLMSNIDPQVPCATCRQKNVYRNAMPVPELETYVRLHFPEVWKKRKAKEERDAANKRRQLEEQKAQKVKKMGFFVRSLDFL